MGKPWENMGKPWENHGKMGIHMENHLVEIGDSMGFHWGLRMAQSK